MIFVASFLAYLYLRFNDKFYNMPIGKITNVHPIHTEKLRMNNTIKILNIKKNLL